MGRTLTAIRFRVGSWNIEEQFPPIPCFAFEAWHDDYDGPDDGRAFTGIADRTSPSELGRLRALQSVVDQIVEHEEEHRA